MDLLDSVQRSISAKKAWAILSAVKIKMWVLPERQHRVFP